MPASMRKLFSLPCGGPVFRAFSLAIFVFAFPLSIWAASAASVDQADGYSGRVLDKVLKIWTPPRLNGDFRAGFQVNLDGNGNVTGCRALKPSGVPALDEGACRAFRDAAPFGSPPYGLPIETYFSFWTGTPKAESAKNQGSDARGASSAQRLASAAVSADADKKYKAYLDKARKKIRDSMYIPVETQPGVYKVTAHIKCDSAGKILAGSIVSTSGDNKLDKYVLRGIQRAKTLPPPPPGLGDSFDLTFTLQR